MKIDKKITAYANSDVDPIKSRHDVELMLEKNGVKTFAWRKDDPQNTYILFQITDNEQKLTFKVAVPFIEKEDKNSPSWKRTYIYDEKRSYRFFYHIFKSMLLNTQIGMSMQQVFGNYLVVGQMVDGTPMNVQDKIGQMIQEKKVPELGVI